MHCAAHAIQKNCMYTICAHSVDIRWWFIRMHAALVCWLLVCTYGILQCIHMAIYTHGHEWRCGDSYYTHIQT